MLLVSEIVAGSLLCMAATCLSHTWAAFSSEDSALSGKKPLVSEPSVSENRLGSFTVLYIFFPYIFFLYTNIANCCHLQ